MLAYIFQIFFPPCSFINLLSKKAGKVDFFSNPKYLPKHRTSFMNVPWDSQQGRELSKSGSNKKNQFCQSYSYVDRKVCYHQIWIPNNLGFMVLILMHMQENRNALSKIASLHCGHGKGCWQIEDLTFEWGLFSPDRLFLDLLKRLHYRFGKFSLLKVASQERDSSFYECSPILGPCSKNPLQNVCLTKLI